MRKTTVTFLSALLMLCLCAAALPGAAFAEALPVPAAQERLLPYRLADAAEGAELMLGNTEYYAGFSQNDLDYKMQKTGATMVEYQAFARE